MSVAGASTPGLTRDNDPAVIVLQEQVAALTLRLEAIEQGQSSVADGFRIPAPPAVVFAPETIQKIVEITQRFFPGLVQVEKNFDPSEPEDVWLDFCVEVEGDIPSILQREADWHRAVHTVVPDWSGVFRICTYPKP